MNKISANNQILEFLSEGLRSRLLSTLFLAPPVLALVFIGGFPFAALLAVAAILMGWEWSKISQGSYEIDGIMLSTLGVCVAFCGARWPHLVFVLIMLVVVLAFFMMRSWRGRDSGLWLASGCLYLGIPLLSLAYLRGNFDRSVFFWLLLLVWATDICAYITGKVVGGPKLMPRVSPKKTWSGLIGGMTGAGLTGLAIGYWFQQPVLWLVVISVLLAICSQVGDMLESMVKRHFGVKDSSNLIPGHGGILDRLDGLLAAAPLALLLCLAYREKFIHW